MSTTFQIRGVVWVALLLFSCNLIAQDTLPSTTHTLSFKPSFIQLKEGANYGLVFNGLNLLLEYSLEKEMEEARLHYSPSLSFAASFKQGIGIAWGGIPIDVFYGRKVNTKIDRSMTIGGYLSTIYNWQLYPELQSGHMFWFTSIEIGPKAVYVLPVEARKVKISLSNSIAGLTSRSNPETETYYYSLTLSDYLSNAHSNMQFGTVNLFNHTKLKVELLRKDQKRLSLGYEFQYFGFYSDTQLHAMSHSLNLTWKIGKL